MNLVLHLMVKFVLDFSGSRDSETLARADAEGTLTARLAAFPMAFTRKTYLRNFYVDLRAASAPQTLNGRPACLPARIGTATLLTFSHQFPKLVPELLKDLKSLPMVDLSFPF